jgi:hypothetical protein
MKVQVHKCRFTGKIFEEKDLKKYAAHLVKLRAEMKQKREQDRVTKEWAKWLKKERARINTIDEIVPWFLANQIKIMHAVNAATSFISDRFYPASDIFTKIDLNVRYNPSASNSHRCPDKGVTNWLLTRDNDPTKPTSYVGWTGNISGFLKRDKKNNYSYPYGEALKIVGLKTGSGGGGNEKWSYEVTIFLDDWPGLKHEIVLMERDLIVKKLLGVTI